jgi:hypothetical protein
MPVGGVAYVNWDFGVPDFETLEIDLTVHSALGVHSAVYLQLYDYPIGSTGSYFGFQTDVWQDGVGGRGKGLLFSRFGTFDLVNAHPVQGGWAQARSAAEAPAEVSPKDIGFVGVRALYSWDKGCYHVRLGPIANTDPAGVWYGLTVTDAAGQVCDAGALRFPFGAGKSPKIKNDGGTWVEFYHPGPDHPDALPPFHVSIDRILGDGHQSRGARIDYRPHAPNVAITFDPATGATHIRVGPGVTRTNGPGLLFRRA